LARFQGPPGNRQSSCVSLRCDCNAVYDRVPRATCQYRQPPLLRLADRPQNIDDWAQPGIGCCKRFYRTGGLRISEMDASAGALGIPDLSSPCWIDNTPLSRICHIIMHELAASCGTKSAELAPRAKSPCAKQRSKGRLLESFASPAHYRGSLTFGIFSVRSARFRAFCCRKTETIRPAEKTFEFPDNP
jgi:hypothetical protein